MRRHTKGKDLLFEAIILKILAEVALMAVKDEQPVRSYLTHLGMLLKAKCVVRPTVISAETENFKSYGMFASSYHAEMWTRPL